MSDFLDVGCGTGQLAIHVAKLGIRSVGVDFAPDIIRVAEEAIKGKTPVRYLYARRYLRPSTRRPVMMSSALKV